MWVTQRSASQQLVVLTLPSIRCLVTPTQPRNCHQELALPLLALHFKDTVTEFQCEEYMYLYLHNRLYVSNGASP